MPAKFIKFKWTIDEILSHESKLYVDSERFSKNELEFFFNQYAANKENKNSSFLAAQR